MSQHEDPERPPETVLGAVGRITGAAPKVLLRESDREAADSPFVSPQARDGRLRLKGRENYQILGEVARGGMGVILKGHDTDLGRDVVVKVLDEHLAGNAALLQRFIEEAQIGGQLQHPGIVPVYELAQMTDERPCFAMKFVKGRTLSALLSKRKGLEDDRRRFLSIFEQVCQTVAYAHSKGVIHRDLKPANVMVGAFGEVQVVDWGLAKVLRSGGVDDELRARRADEDVIETVRSGPATSGADSVAGSVMGTPAYMAREQAMGAIDEVDERSDVFALGAILCEILTGKPPYVSVKGERTVLLAAQAKLGPARDRIAESTVDAELKRLCLECLAPAPGARPENAEQVAQRIHEHLASLEERAHRAELAATEAREERRRRRLAVVLATTVVAAVVAIAFVLRRVEVQRQADRARQLESARAQLDDAAGQVAELQDRGRPDEALEVARAALFVLESGARRDPALSARARRMVAVAEERVAEAAARRALERRNEELLARCDELRVQQIETVFDFGAPFSPGDLEADYDRAFQLYGIDVDGADLVAALETLVESGIGPEVALALDDWASLRRELHGADSLEVEAVTALAFDLDLDPARTQLREALLASDRDALLVFAEQQDLERLPASTLWVLCQALSSFELEQATFRVARAGALAHPEDFLLNIRVGDLYGERGANEPAVRFLSAARAVRPESAAAAALLGDRLLAMKDFPAAVALYEEAVRLEPGYSNVYTVLAFRQLILGDYEGGLRSFEAARAASPGQPEHEFWVLLGRYAVGDLSAASLIGRVRTDAALTDVQEYCAAWMFTHHLEPDRRAPELALEILAAPAGSEHPFTGGLAAAALIEAGRPREALVALDLAAAAGAADRDLRANRAAYRTRALLELGELAEAEQAFELCAQLLDEIQYDGPEPWSRMPRARWHRENAARLGR